jgi:hypothetical protein
MSGVRSMIPPALRLAMWKAPTWQLSHPDGSPYLTRHVLWGCDCLENHNQSVPSSGFIHEIHTPDSDRHLHDHPWEWAIAVVLAGGYREHRGTVAHKYNVGDLNILRPGDYHSIVAVEPNTVTLFVCGRENYDWGFLVEGRHVPHREYFLRDDAQHMTHERIS